MENNNLKTIDTVESLPVIDEKEPKIFSEAELKSEAEDNVFYVFRDEVFDEMVELLTEKLQEELENSIDCDEIPRDITYEVASKFLKPILSIL